MNGNGKASRQDSEQIKAEAIERGMSEYIARLSSQRLGVLVVYRHCGEWWSLAMNVDRASPETLAREIGAEYAAFFQELEWLGGDAAFFPDDRLPERRFSRRATEWYQPPACA